MGEVATQECPIKQAILDLPESEFRQIREWIVGDNRFYLQDALNNHIFSAQSAIDLAEGCVQRGARPTEQNMRSLTNLMNIIKRVMGEE